ncbi:MAG: hypothetical protein ACSHXI_21915 [Hoeflea sp.]|uniref:hypothetical protein n=1 Tax=Hoeflea sp. TaxID=1940281 RepID=UPI003EFA376F
MQQDQQIALRFLRASLLIFLAIALSACAGRPKQLDPNRPYTVTEVRVMADRIENRHFAVRLQTRLEASVGRATADVGQTSTLRILVLDRREERSPVYLFGGMSQSVSLDLTLVDKSTGQVLRSEVLHLNFTDFNESNAETVLISRLTDDIRSLLGLSGHTPYPVSGVKREVVRPSSKPDDADGNDKVRGSFDPLLNGTVTPTTMVLDVEQETAPAVDYTKPLLGAQPAAEPSSPASTVTPTPSRPAQQTMKLPVQKSPTAVTDDGTDPEEPCVITLENDCSDPGSH